MNPPTVGAHGASGVSAVRLAEEDNSSGRGCARRAIARDRRRVLVRVTRNLVRENGAAGRTGVPVQCRVVWASGRGLETVCRRTNARESRWSIRSASSPAAIVSLVDLFQKPLN